MSWQNDDHRVIIATTDFVSSASEIVRLYAWRFRHSTVSKLSVTSSVAQFNFWSQAIGKIKKGKTFSDVIDSVTDPKERNKIIRSFRRTELYTAMVVIAMGITQLLCLKFRDLSNCKKILYFRTRKKDRASEREMKIFLNQNLIDFALKEPESVISEIILGLRERYLAYPEVPSERKKAA